MISDKTMDFLVANNNPQKKKLNSPVTDKNRLNRNNFFPQKRGEYFGKI
jgi:hypothetical protein